MSTETRLNRIYPQDSLTTTEDLSYIFRVQSEGPFIVATGNKVTIRSAITEAF